VTCHFVCGLFDYLNGGVWALNLACSADKTFIGVYNLGFTFNDFKDTHRTNVLAGTAAVTFVVVDLDFNHDLRPNVFLDSNQINSPE